MRNVAGRVALITGGAQGMGKELGAHFVRDGAKLVIWDMAKDALDKTVEEHKRSGKDVFGFVIDITNQKEVLALAKRIEKEIGPVDILVNNAGIVAGGEFLDVPIEKHTRVIDVNVNAVMICTYAFLPGMMERNCGHIVNMASAGGLLGVAGLTSYCASKFAVVGFTETLRFEFAHRKLHGIKTLTVCPSLVSSGMFEGAVPPKTTKFLTPKYMADRIFDAIKKNKVYLMEPFMVRTISLFKAIGNPHHLPYVTEALGMGESMKNLKGRNNVFPPPACK